MPWIKQIISLIDNMITILLNIIFVIIVLIVFIYGYSVKYDDNDK